MACTRLATRHHRQPDPSTQSRRTLPSADSALDERKDIGAQNSRSGGEELYPVGFPAMRDYPLISSPAVLSMWAGMPS